MVLKAVKTARDIGATHDMLFEKGIWTKSMLKTYLRCPVTFEQRYVYGAKEPPGWAMALGNLSDNMLQVWGERTMAAKPFPDEEAREYLHESWKELIAGPRLVAPPSEPHPHADQKIGSLMKCYKEFKRKIPALRLNKLTHVQPAFGYEGDILLGAVPIAGHPDFVFDVGPVDLKTVKNNSAYRKNGLLGNLPDYVFQAVLAGNMRSALLLFIHNFKTDRQDRVEYKSENLKPVVLDTTTEILHRVATAVARGDFPPTVTTGTYPCVKDWCGFYGKCPVTKGL